MFRELATRALILASSAVVLATGGCQWYESLRGPGFPGWEESGGVRGKNPEARPSGFFTSRKAEQVEKSLGGDY
jgi:hypothetical protein